MLVGSKHVACPGCRISFASRDWSLGKDTHCFVRFTVCFMHYCRQFDIRLSAYVIPLIFGRLSHIRRLSLPSNVLLCKPEEQSMSHHSKPSSHISACQIATSQPQTANLRTSPTSKSHRQHGLPPPSQIQRLHRRRLPLQPTLLSDHHPIPTSSTSSTLPRPTRILRSERFDIRPPQRTSGAHAHLQGYCRLRAA